ncbi:MAG: hypothetical protein RIB59_17900 [Rhodospirillales bacterium]
MHVRGLARHRFEDAKHRAARGRFDIDIALRRVLVAVDLGAAVITDKRAIPADDFFLGLFETALEPGEIIVRVSFLVPKRSGYGRFANPASRFPLVGAFVAEASAGPRVAVTGGAACSESKPSRRHWPNRSRPKTWTVSAYRRTA